jgi:serine/threonine protein phosphatase 1
MSDIHGCYDEFMRMLEKISFSDNDTLIIAGDYIDRGTKSYEMLRWIETKPGNVILLMGNHDKEFAYNVQLMKMVIKKNGLNVDVNSIEQTRVIYELTKQLAIQGNGEVSFFDYYGTMRYLIDENNVTLADFIKWEKIIADFPYYYRIHIADRDCIAVHAGYIESLDGIDTDNQFSSIEDFYMYARDDAYIYGGVLHGMIIAGHTPTIAEQELPFNDGNVYRSYDKDIDCIFYDIDCGCAFSKKHSNAKLACIRLEDEKVFYVNPIKSP